MSGSPAFPISSEKSYLVVRSDQDTFNFQVMQTAKSKNQNTQLPAQVAAVNNHMNVLPAICAVKATLHHIDGHVSEITMTLPHYSGWEEFLEDGQNSIRGSLVFPNFLYRNSPLSKRS